MVLSESQASADSQRDTRVAMVAHLEHHRYNVLYLLCDVLLTKIKFVIDTAWPAEYGHRGDVGVDHRLRQEVKSIMGKLSFGIKEFL